MKPELSEKVKEEVQKLLDAGFIEVANYPEWVANIVVVPKKDGRVRICIDFRDLNKASPKDDFPLPHIDILVDSAAMHFEYSFMDGYAGYNQILIDPEDKLKTTFITAWGTFCFRVMPFGLKNAGATYQRAMTTLFHDLMHKEMEVYVDDMIVKSKRAEDHIEVLRKIFNRLMATNLKLNPAKCIFGVSSGKLLGFIVSRRGIELDPDKIKAIQDMPPPKTQKEVRGFLGRLNYIARFISQLTATCEPIFKLLRKNQPCEWNENCQEAFDKIKRYLQSPPILRPPEPKRPLLLYLTVQETSMGCMLAQHDQSGKKENAIYYLSKRFNSCESRYSPLEKSCCALAWVAQRLRHYLLSNTTWLISRIDPLKYIFEKPYLTSRIARWQLLLSQHDIVYMTQKSIKGSAISEFLSTQPINEYEPASLEFPDEDVLAVFKEDLEKKNSKEEHWILLFDGASNAMGRGIGAVLISPDGKQFPMAAKLKFEGTNNTAEYEACAMGIRAAKELKVKSLMVYGDSILVVNQMKNRWQTRDSKLAPYHEYLAQLIEDFEAIEFDYIPREKNQIADALATLAAMMDLELETKTQTLQIEVYNTPAYCMSLEIEHDGEPWFYDIKQFIQHGEYPPDAAENDKKTIRRLSTGYFLSGDVLYKRGIDGVLLRCVDSIEAKQIVEEIHEGECGAHANGHSMSRKITRMGYYWLGMEADCIEYVRRCYKCQIYANKMKVAPVPLNVLTSPWPFSMWGMDVIGPISPKASNGHRFILVAIDYFTKWVEAASYANVTRNVVVKFVKNNIISRYGLPERIITDNGTNLNNKLMSQLCKKFKIKHHNSAPYRPKMNGAVEAANKNIKRIIEKMTVTYKDWHDKLPYALYAYCTTVRTSTGATPFSLVYGMEAVVPVEVEIPTLRVLMETKLDEAEWVKVRYDQLNMLDEKRLVALCHGQLYQRRLMRSYDKKMRPRKFKEGDLVLKQILPIQSDFRGKWAPSYEGPYVVKQAFSGGALILEKMDGDELPHPVNSDIVKKYYP